MDWIHAAAWGLFGGLAAGLLGLMTALNGARFRWPWKREQVGPRLCFYACALALGALVAAAAHAQMSGAWPAFVIGAGAPATVRGLLTGVEVHTKLDPTLVSPDEPGTGRAD